MDNDKMKILIIEDDPELAMVLSSYLSKYGMEVTAVEDPYIGLSTLTQQDFDLVILDLTLPGMDGLEVVEKRSRISPSSSPRPGTISPTR